MSNATIFTSAFTVNAEGLGMTGVEFPVEIHAGTGLFSMVLPHYVAAILKRESVESDTLHETVEGYEAACEEYQRVRLGNQGRKVLLVDASGGDKLQSLLMSATGSALALKYLEDTEVAGVLLRYERLRSHYQVIADTPANRNKLNTMIDSLQIASAILNGLEEASDPETYLQQIQLTATTTVPSVDEQNVNVTVQVAEDENDL